MINRRRVVEQGMVLGTALCVCRPVAAQWLPPSAPPAAVARPVAPVCGVDRLGAAGGAGLDALRRLPSSGVAEVDQHLPAERALLDKLFRVSPGFAFFDDGGIPQARTRWLGDDQTEVLLGQALVRGEIERQPMGWQTALIGILAHEWAHAFQYTTRLQERTFMWETHADFLAGWYLGNKVAMGVARLAPAAFADSLYRRGSGRGFFDPDDYGRAEVRVAAMEAGFRHARRWFRPQALPDLHDAVDAGYALVSQLRR